MEMRDADRLAQLIRGLDARKQMGRVTSIERDALRAGLRVVEGDPGGLAAFDAAIASDPSAGSALPARHRAFGHVRCLSPTAARGGRGRRRGADVINELGAVTLLRGLPADAPAAGDAPAAVPAQGELAGRRSTTVSGATSERPG